ncbi:3-carboxy-cis,cis-muconate cycloisomerase [Niveispirillum sp. KHB5.9]|uniref:3-carboxy-cis,cis-muconate cycloisomerase n=1 Tax=Niveispirillum sp. KHB5.9 TaxID=3400269 RepID=UPI003A866D19
MTSLFTPLFQTEAMAALFADEAVLSTMLRVEAALARAQSRVGMVPPTALPAIEAACDAGLYDLAALGRATALAGNPAIPLVKALTAQVAAADPAAARHVHRGATSQDIIDTGLVLRTRDAVALIRIDLERAIHALATLARTHAATPMAGRTLWQQALPVTFGLKAAGWLSLLLRVRSRLKAAGEAASTLQFGGAAGTLASQGGQGLDIAAALADELSLTLPDMPWHSQRDRIADLGAALGLLAGALGKIARDIAHLMSSEVAEAFEPAAAGKGGSSAMPHKRNPVGTTIALSAAARAPGLVATLLSAMVQEQERGVGGWHAEWPVLAELFLLASGAAAHMADTLSGLELDLDAMRANLDLTNGLMMAEPVTQALAEASGRHDAVGIVEAACKRAVAAGHGLLAALTADPAVTAHLPPDRLAELTRPENYLGSAAEFVARVLASYERERV